MNRPLPFNPAPDADGIDVSPLLDPPFAKVWDSAGRASLPSALRGRLLNRLLASREAEAAMTTMRRSRTPRDGLAPGVTVQTLYAAPADRPLRPGEPLRVRLIALAPGASILGPLLGQAGASSPHRELMVLSGALQLAQQTLSQRDYHVLPAGAAMPPLHSSKGALLFLRESDLAAQAGDQPFTVLDAKAGWADFAPGIQRRVLWQRQGQAALLYHAQPRAQVPQHSHGHDEECLMLQGELFLDDLLLQPGDYQLAPAGTGHRVTETDTGVVIYAHGDLDLQFLN